MTPDVSMTEEKVDELKRRDVTECHGSTNAADSSEIRQVSVGELYGCVCHRPTKDFPSSASNS